MVRVRKGDEKAMRRRGNSHSIIPFAAGKAMPAERGRLHHKGLGILGPTTKGEIVASDTILKQIGGVNCTDDPPHASEPTAMPDDQQVP